jgi:hypothetical protein
VMGRGGRRSKKLLDDLEGGNSNSKLKEGAMNRTLWRTCLGRGYGPAIRQTTE